MYIEYFAKCHSDHAGVYNKIINTVEAFKERGFVATAIIERKLGISGTLSIAKRMVKSEADIILLRSLSYNMLILIPIFLYLNFKKKKLILDVPTPTTIQFSEIKDSELSEINKNIRLAILVVTFPFITCFFFRVLQYAPESKYFNFTTK